ncbi:bifunctional nuclease family protein [Halomonas sp. 328]|nr:bifunctional nuclease family protein [Halomonas sp. 328]
MLPLRHCLCASLILLPLLSLSAQARELAVEPETMIEVEVATVGLAGPGVPVVLLREPGARAVIPIFIGPVEADAILRGLRGDRPRRPLTHELLGDVLAGLEVRLERVYVDAIVDGVFLGMLELRVGDAETPLRIDSRASDAIALGLQAGAGIRVSPQVLEAAQAIEYQGIEEQVVSALGITVTPLSDDLRDALRLPDDAGVLITGVTGDAEAAGLAPGALLLTVNGETPTTPLRFLELVRDTPPGEDARLGYWQDGEAHELSLSTAVPEPALPRTPPEAPPPGIRM